MAKDYSTTRQPISNTLLGKVAEIVGIKEGLNPNQKKIKLATMSQKVVKQALKRAGIIGFAASEALDFIMSQKPKKTGSKGQMGRVDKKDTPPAPKMRPKDLKKDTPPKTPPKKPQQFNLKTGGKGDAQTRLDEIKKEKLAAKQKALVKGSKGVATGLKMPTADQVGLKKLPTPVRNKMGYMYGGGMAKKPRMSSMDYRKGGLLVISIDMMKKNKKGKKEK
jgi:hypothetical protein